MADSNFGQNKKDAEDYYKTQLRIAKVIKEQTESFSTYADAVKKVRENAKIIQANEKEIARLRAIGTKEAQASAAALQKEVDYVKSLNKELLKTGNLIRASAKSIGSWGIDKLVSLGKNLFEVYNKIDGSARRTTIQMGMSRTRMEQFRNISIQAADDLARMGIEGEKAGEMLGSFAESAGRQLMLTQQSIIGMGALAKRTGMAEAEVAAMAGQMESFGLSSNNSVAMMEEIADISDKMGVNTSKILKKVQQNIGLLNRLSFKDGVKGMAKMAMQAEKYKLSMEASAGFAEKVMRPEGAIDAAANLQVLGGSLAQMGDAFQLMGQARNDPETFAKNITKAAAATAEWDAKLGEFRVSAYEMDRLRQVSEATGVSLEELVSTAKQGAKINKFADSLKVSGDDREFLSSIMEADQMGAFLVDTEGAKQYLKNLSATQQQDYANQLRATKDGSMSRQQDAQTTQELIENSLNSLQAKLLPTIKKLDDSLRPSIERLADELDGFVNKLFKIFNGWIPKLILALMLFAVGWPILKGLWSVMSTFWAVGKNLFGRGGSMASQMVGGGGPGGGNMVQAKSGKFYDANSPQGKMIQTKGGTTPLGGQSGANPSQTGDAAGKSASNMLKGAAAILILSAALFVFAKALQEFDKLQNGWETLGMAAVSLLVLSGALYLVGQIVGNAAMQILLGSVAILALGAALVPFGYAMSLLKDVGIGTMLGAALALGAFALAAGLMGAALIPILLGSVAIVALSGAIMVFGYALSYIAPHMEMFLTSLGQLPGLLPSILMGGPALLGLAAGITTLGLSLVALGASYALGGFMGIFALSETGEEIQKAFKGIDTKSLAVAVVAINRLDMNKVNALKEMATALSMASMFGGGMKVDFGDLEVKGTITLKSGSGVSKSTDWVNDPIFVTKLKNVVWESLHKGKKGGKV